MSDYSPSYIAGFLDGDGCIGIYRVKRRRSSSWHYILQVIFTQSRKDKARVLKYIQEQYGGFICRVWQQNTNCQEAWALRLSGIGAGRLIEDCRDFMIVRRKQADLALKFLAFRKQYNGQQFGRTKLPQEITGQYEVMRNLMKYYNQRGLNN